MKTPIEQLQELVEIQGSNGNYNYDRYMHGMYNGMELALAIMENREPVYKDAPEQWLSEKETSRIQTEPEAAH